MIDIKLIRENPEKFKTACKAKKIPADIDLLMNIDSQLSDSRKKLQDIVTTKNQIGKSIPKMAGDEKQAALSRLSELKKQEAGLEEKIENLTPQFDQIMQQVAQPADDDVPFG